MPIEIIVPRLGWSMEEGALVAWLKQDGDFVRAGEPLLSIEGDKAIQEIESIDSGILRIAVNGPKPGDSIRVGDVLGYLVSGAEPTPQPTPAGRKATATSTIRSGTPSPLPSPLVPAGEKAMEGRAKNLVQSGAIPTISPRALRVAAELGVDWTKVAGTGRTGRIRERDIYTAAGAGATTSAAPRRSRDDTKQVVLVTGGSGFIGTWVVRDLLERGLGVVVLDTAARPARWQTIIGPRSQEVTLVQGSLLDRELLAQVFAENRVGHVIHLAALLTPACQSDPWEGCRMNVLGSVALFEEIRKSATPVRGLSYASSVAVFGDEPDSLTPMGPGENCPPTFYGAFKRSVELIAGQYWRHYQVASVGVRPQVAYGPERDVGLTAGPSLAARAAARGEPFCISYTGRVGYDYVEDVARAFVRGALETPAGAQVVDLPGAMAEVSEVIAAIAEAMPGTAPQLSMNGPPIPAHAPPHPRFISELYPDWKTTSLTEGMRRTVTFYQT